MNDKNLILRILDETNIINSALKAENIEIVSASLDVREQLYSEYDSLSIGEKNFLKNTMKNDIEKIRNLDQINLELVKKINGKLMDLFKQNADKKARLKKGGAVNKKYRNPYDVFTSGRFDAKF